MVQYAGKVGVRLSKKEKRKKEVYLDNLAVEFFAPYAVDCTVSPP